MLKALRIAQTLVTSGSFWRSGRSVGVVEAEQLKDHVLTEEVTHDEDDKPAGHLSFLKKRNLCSSGDPSLN